MKKSERAIVIILRVLGVAGLFAIPAIFLPHSWMNAIHEFAGLGELPDVPIVSYLTRSLSTFYAVVSVILLTLTTDIRRYRPVIKVWAVLVTLTGAVLFGVDLTAGMPLSWTLCEGPPTIVVGLVVMTLSRRIADMPSQDNP